MHNQNAFDEDNRLPRDDEPQNGPEESTVSAPLDADDPEVTEAPGTPDASEETTRETATASPDGDYKEIRKNYLNEDQIKLYDMLGLKYVTYTEYTDEALSIEFKPHTLYYNVNGVEGKELGDIRIAAVIDGEIFLLVERRKVKVKEPRFVVKRLIEYFDEGEVYQQYVSLPQDSEYFGYLIHDYNEYVNQGTNYQTDRLINMNVSGNAKPIKKVNKDLTFGYVLLHILGGIFVYIVIPFIKIVAMIFVYFIRMIISVFAESDFGSSFMEGAGVSTKESRAARKYYDEQREKEEAEYCYSAKGADGDTIQLRHCVSDIYYDKNGTRYVKNGDLYERR